MDPVKNVASYIMVLTYIDINCSSKGLTKYYSGKPILYNITYIAECNSMLYVLDNMAEIYTDSDISH